MREIGTLVVKEIREAMPAAILFLFLFHMIALTKAVLMGDYSITALRATTATLAALIVAKAILVVEALPVAGFFAQRRAVNILWKTLLYGAVAIVFRLIEEIVPLASEHGVARGAELMVHGISWPVFWVMTLWVFGGLLLYCIAAELVRVAGAENVKKLFFGRG